MLIVETKRKRNKITTTRRTRLVFIGRTWYAHYGRLAAVNTNGPYVTRMCKRAVQEVNMQIRVVFVYTLFIRTRTYRVHDALSTVPVEVVIR